MLDPHTVAVLSLLTSVACGFVWGMTIDTASVLMKFLFGMATVSFTVATTLAIAGL